MEAGQSQRLNGWKLSTNLFELWSTSVETLLALFPKGPAAVVEVVNRAGL
jgi:hypothetical protein